MLNSLRNAIGILVLTAVLGGCVSMPEVLIWDGTKMGDYSGAGGEFAVDYPHDDFRIREVKREDFFAVDFIGAKVFKPQYIYSVEWSTLSQDKAQTDAEFFASWQDFLPTYLAGNFGEGRYEQVQWQQIDTFPGRPAFRFVGTGTHNGGDPGTIYGTVVGFGHRVAVLYALGPPLADPKANWDALPGYPVYWAFASSLRCQVGCD